MLLGGKVCTLFISMDYGIVSSERDNRKNHIFFSLQMFSRLWEQVGLLTNDPSLCGCPRVLQEEVLVVFLWGPVQAPPRKKKLNSRNFLQWSGLGRAQQRQGCSGRGAQPPCLAALLPCVGPSIKDCAVPGLFSFPH